MKTLLKLIKQGSQVLVLSYDAKATEEIVAGGCKDDTQITCFDVTHPLNVMEILLEDGVAVEVVTGNK